MYRIAGVGQMRLRQENKKAEIMDVRENLNVINGQLNQHITGNTNMNIIGGWRSVTNDGTGTVAGNGGYRKDYFTKTQVPRGFDVGNVYLAWGLKLRAHVVNTKANGASVAVLKTVRVIGLISSAS
jgi:hypothetical protein